jgi:hypothetical protein
MGLFDWLNHAKRISELEDVCAHLSHRMDEEELKYVELRARTKRLLDRTEKAARAVDLKDSIEPEGPTGDMPGIQQGVNGRSLSDHQRQIQQQILRRRAGM